MTLAETRRPVGRVAGHQDLPGRHEREQRLQVGRATTRRCRRTGSGGRAPRARSRPGRRCRRGPGSAAGRGGAGQTSTACRPSAGIPRPAWTRIGSRRSSASANTACEVRVVERELLGARVELDARARPRSRQRSASASGVAVRVEPAEREQPAAGGLRLRDHHVVGGRIAVGLVHREDEGARVDPLERADRAARGCSCSRRGRSRPMCVWASSGSSPPTSFWSSWNHGTMPLSSITSAQTTKSRAGSATARRSRGRA